MWNFAWWLETLYRTVTFVVVVGGALVILDLIAWCVRHRADIRRRARRWNDPYLYALPCMQRRILRQWEQGRGLRGRRVNLAKARAELERLGGHKRYPRLMAWLDEHPEVQP